MSTKPSHFHLGRGLLAAGLSLLGSILLAFLILLMWSGGYTGTCIRISDLHHYACTFGQYLNETLINSALYAYSLYGTYILSILGAIIVLGFLIGAIPDPRPGAAVRPEES